MTRKYLQYSIGLLSAVAVLISVPVRADSTWDTAELDHHGSRDITVYRSASCNCCSKWVTHLEKHGFNVSDEVVGELGALKYRHGVPPGMASCHTAVIDGYVIEGHVPADDIKRLIRDRPDVAGLSVPRMPVGTPGMEMGDRRDPFAVYQFTGDGEAEVFRSYPGP